MGGERGKAGDSDAVRAGLKSGTSLALVIGLVLTGLVLIVLIIVVVIVCSRNRYARVMIPCTHTPAQKLVKK